LQSVAGRIAIAAAPGIGMLIYSAYMYWLTGDPLQWAKQNAAWGRVYKGLEAVVAERFLYVQHYGLYDYASSRSLDMLQGFAVLFVFASVWPVYRRFGVPYAALLLVNLVTPLMMGGLLSMGRLTSTLFPLFLALASILPSRAALACAAAFGVLQGLAAALFFTWRELY
jgi:hypothetical protein